MVVNRTLRFGVPLTSIPYKVVNNADVEGVYINDKEHSIQDDYCICVVTTNLYHVSIEPYSISQYMLNENRYVSIVKVEPQFEADYRAFKLGIYTKLSDKAKKRIINYFPNSSVRKYIEMVLNGDEGVKEHIYQFVASPAHDSKAILHNQVLQEIIKNMEEVESIPIVNEFFQ